MYRKLHAKSDTRLRYIMYFKKDIEFQDEIHIGRQKTTESV